MFSFFKKHSVIGGVLIVLVILVSTGAIFRSKKNQEEVKEQVQTIKLVPVSDFTTDKQTVQATGVVESLEQAEIRSQFPAPVTKILVKVGDTVKRGQTLVTLQNSDVYAQLEQALAGVKAQEARLEEFKRGARAEDLKISSNDIDQANEAYQNALTGAVTAINAAIFASEDAVKNQAEPLFVNETGKLSFSTNNVQAQIDAESDRKIVKENLSTWRAAYSKLDKTPTEAAVLGLLTESKKQLGTVKTYLDHVYDTLSDAHITPQFPQATITGYKTAIGASRNAINGSITSMNGMEQGIAAAKIGKSRAEDILALKKAGYTDEQIKTQSAALDQARAAADGLRAQLEKTIIQAPIDGKIVSLPVRIGELVNMGQLVVSIINTKGLQVKAYVSEDDVARMEINTRVEIESGIEGTLLNIAPGLDRQTKKVEIKVLVTGEGNLIVGQDAKITIPVKKSIKDEARYFLPIQNVKIVPGNAYVYTVNEQSIVVAHPVILGEVRGDFIEVKEGILPSMKIVSPVYDIKEGTTVNAEQ